MTAWRVLPLVLLLAACGSGRGSGLATPLPPSDAERLVRLAEREAQAGNDAEAVRLFEEVLRQPSPGFTDRALVGLTRLYVDPGSVTQNYQRAYLVAERLVKEHPDSAHAAETRAWRDLLASYLARGQELQRRAMELDQIALELKGRTQRIEEQDQELEQRTREVERLSQELKRLRILDVELEKRTQELERLSYELERRNRELQRLKRLDLELEQQKKKP